jgi:hypothetical protein
MDMESSGGIFKSLSSFNPLDKSGFCGNIICRKSLVCFRVWGDISGGTPRWSGRCRNSRFDGGFIILEVPMNEISSRIILTSLVLSLGIALIFLSVFLLRFLYKPWVVLILSLIGAIIIGLVIKHAGAKSEEKPI